MLAKTQLDEIKEHLKKAQNPLFFFDNDNDGLCSFLILARYLGRGKGVAIKSSPDLNESYVRKLNELNPDYVFVLDKPLISDGFLEGVKNLNLPLVWIDHHGLGKSDEKNQIYYYDPLKPTKKVSKKDEIKSKPVTYLAWKLTGREEDEWLALIGCFSDGYLPEFSSDFAKKYPDFWQDVKSAFQGLYETDLGKIARIMSFGLKDRTSKVIQMLKFLLQVKFPFDIYADKGARGMLNRFKQINRKYEQLIERAKKFAKGKLLYFQYGGDLSLSADISNELFYLYPNKIIVVAYIKGTKANISIRGKNNVKELTLKAIENLEGATGGGHINATGAKIDLEDLPVFKERIEKLVNKS